MAWCPKCKSEYREGFTRCADCGSELVSELPVEDKKLSEPEVELFEVPEELAEELSEELPEERPARRRVVYQPYQDSSERANENRSSGGALLGIGGVGIVLVVLGIAGVLPLNLSNTYLFYGVMGAICVLFFVAGIMSLKNAKFFEKKAESENTLRTTLTEWCKENLKATMIDAAVRAPGDAEEILYFKRFTYIRERLNRQFVNLDQGFLERFIDDYVYEDVFGEFKEENE